MASSRVYVQESIVTKFTELYVQAIRQLSGQAGNPLEKETGFGPQADAQQFKSVSEYLQKAQDDKLQKVSIGAAPEKGNNFIAPVVFQDVPEGHALMKDEIFGSVKTVIFFLWFFFFFFSLLLSMQSFSDSPSVAPYLALTPSPARKR